MDPPTGVWARGVAILHFFWARSGCPPTRRAQQPQRVPIRVPQRATAALCANISSDSECVGDMAGAAEAVTSRRRGRWPVTAASAPLWTLLLLLPLLGAVTASRCGRQGNGTLCSATSCCSGDGECGVNAQHCSRALGCHSGCWVCGDGLCAGADQPGGETCGTCPTDCGPCTSGRYPATVADVRSACVAPDAFALTFDAVDNRCGIVCRTLKTGAVAFIELSPSPALLIASCHPNVPAGITSTVVYKCPNIADLPALRRAW